MNPIFFKPGQQHKLFTVYRKKTEISPTGRVSDTPEPFPVGTLMGSIAQASQKDNEQFGQIAHPITHTLVTRGKVIARTTDILVLGTRRFYVQHTADPGELGIFTILYCEEEFGVGGSNG